MLEQLLNLLYPPSCYVCDKKTDNETGNLCVDCLRKLKKRFPPFCKRCGKKLHGSFDLESRCRDCVLQEPSFDRAFSVFHYEGILKELIHNFKYRKMTSLIPKLIEITIDFMNQYKIGKEADIVLGIPMHAARLFEREINTSDILARNIARRLRLKYSCGILKKTKYTIPQSKLQRHERIKNIQGSFSIQKGKDIELKNKRILLVDDLFTTGSTVNECAKVLKDAGASHVEVITLARGDSAV